MADRPELEKYIGRKILIHATVKSRADGGQYGFLLTDIVIPGNVTLDHVWLKVYWLDLAEMSGRRILGMATVDEYWKDGRRDGKYVEGIARGVGFSELDCVKVRNDQGVFVPLADAATKKRKTRRESIKESKASGSYVWPGAWTYSTGSVAVRAAKSAVPGSRCYVKARDTRYEREVLLQEQLEPGIWSFSEMPKATAA